jgi:hypothetical protein
MASCWELRDNLRRKEAEGRLNVARYQCHGKQALMLAMWAEGWELPPSGDSQVLAHGFREFPHCRVVGPRNTTNGTCWWDCYWYYVPIPKWDLARLFTRAGGHDLPEAQAIRLLLHTHADPELVAKIDGRRRALVEIRETYAAMKALR